MKLSISILFSLLLFFQQGNSQSCCQAPGGGMSEFSSDKNFALAHAEPLPFNRPADAEVLPFTFSCKDGKEGKGVKKEGTMKKYLLLFHEWWGLNEYIKEQVSYWHKKMGGKVTVIAVDMYDGKVANDRETASGLMNALSAARSEALIEGILATIPEEGTIATLGWCMGGGLSLQAAMAGGYKVKACAMYYGMPEMDSDKLKRLKAPVYGIFAQRDKWITQKVVDDFYQAMAKANRELRYESFDADHAFANPSNPDYNKKMAFEAEMKISGFIKKQLGGIL
jgi:carboxymethylenebutenolidase